MYHPYDYWQERGKHYQHSETDEELQILKSVMDYNQIKTALEVGSGDGRVFNYLKPDIPYHMVDFVDSFRASCVAKTGVLPDKWDAVTLPYPDNSFDLVISVSVLLHVPPADIRQHIKELMRVSDKYVFIASCDTGSEYGLDEGHCQRHDYASIFKELDYTVVLTEVTCNGMRKVFVLRKD